MRQESSSERIVWYVLVGLDRSPIMGTARKLSLLPQDKNIDDFRVKVSKIMSPRLGHISPNDLTVFRNLYDRTSASPDTGLDGLGQSAEQALIVVSLLPLAAQPSIDLGPSAGLPSVAHLVSDVEAFRLACLDLDVDSIQYKDVVELRTGVWIMGDMILGSRLFIREPYPEFLGMILEIFGDKSKSFPHIIVMGTPGIGKSFFGYLVAMILIRRGQSVVFEYARGNRSFYFRAERSRPVAVGSLYEFSPFVTGKTYYICDDCLPASVSVPTLLLTPPHRKHWYQFSKDPCCFRYMPLWTLNELEDCRELLFPNITQCQLKSAYAVWGGCAKATLQISDPESHIETVNAIMQSLDLASLHIRVLFSGFRPR